MVSAGKSDIVPIPPFVLIERAHSDVTGLQTALDSFGYYLNKVDITRWLKAQATPSTVNNATATKGSTAQDNGSSIGLSYQFEYCAGFAVCP